MRYLYKLTFIDGRREVTHFSNNLPMLIAKAAGSTAPAFFRWSEQNATYLVLKVGV